MATLTAGSPKMETFTRVSMLRVVRSLSDELPTSIDALARAAGVSRIDANHALHLLLVLDAVSRLPGDRWQLRADGLRRALSTAYDDCGF